MPPSEKPENTLYIQDYLNFVKLNLKIFKWSVITLLVFVSPWVILRVLWMINIEISDFAYQIFDFIGYVLILTFQLFVFYLFISLLVEALKYKYYKRILYVAISLFVSGIFAVAWFTLGYAFAFGGPKSPAQFLQYYVSLACSAIAIILPFATYYLTGLKYLKNNK